MRVILLHSNGTHHSVAKEHYKYAINLANTHLKQETINLGQVYGVHIMTWFVIQPRTRESDCEFS